MNKIRHQFGIQYHSSYDTIRMLGIKFSVAKRDKIYRSIEGKWRQDVTEPHDKVQGSMSQLLYKTSSRSGIEHKAQIK